MKPSRRFFPLVLALAVVVFLPQRARADDRLAGYWVPAPGEESPAAFSFGILGRWTLVSARWDGSTAGPNVRYTVVVSGAAGTLTADQNLDRLPDVPHAITYQVKGGELFLAVPDTSHAGRYHLVKGEPPASASAAAPPGPPPASESRPSPPRVVQRPAVDPNAVLGGWTAEPGSEVEINIFIAMAGPTSVKINQHWNKYGEEAVYAQGDSYSVSFSPTGGGTLTRSKAGSGGPAIPERIDYSFDRGAMIVDVPEGPFSGRYRLVRKAK